MEELKPCPFCGGAPTFEEISRQSADGINWSLGCNTEDCFGNQSFAVFNTKGDAAKGWNTRFQPETPGEPK